ncbi:MAG TPA: alpha/beta fold hydrolase, partial [Solirubrobacteraceae bacterium]|nr:alpha/beta fold hydrolase [Solirubrobacteraceae bacterium]
GRETGMAQGVDEAAFERFARQIRERLGMLPLGVELGLELFDAAGRVAEAVAVPVLLDAASLRAQARSGMLPALLRDLVRVPAQVGSGALARRLAGVPKAEWESVILAFVQGEVATVIGLDSPTTLDPQTSFTELGFDSLAAVELRNRLIRATGVQLPPTLVFDYESPELLARHLHEQALRRGVGGARTAAGAQDGGTLTTLVRHAHKRGAVLESVPLLMEASRLLPAFDSAAELEQPPRCVRLSTGAAPPRVICIPTFLAGSGPHHFARFAKGLGGSRAVAACTLPGFRAGDLLPGSWSAVIDALAASVRAAVEDDPFVLVGYSIGGVVAHMLAERFESEGAPPAGVVLIDTYAPPGEAEMAQVLASVLGVLLSMDSELVAIDDHNLMVMGTYLRLFGEAQPASIETPSLLIRASEPLGEGLGAGLQRLAQQPDETVEVAGHHFGLIEEEAETTARATEAWILDRCTPGESEE